MRADLEEVLGEWLRQAGSKALSCGRIAGPMAEELLPLQAPRLRETESPPIQRRQAAMGIPDASSQFVQAVGPQPQRSDQGRDATAPLACS